MNLNENNEKNNNESLLQLFSNLINNIKEKKYNDICELSISSKQIILKEIEKKQNQNIDNNNILINKELITQLSFFKDINSYVKDTNILFQIKTILNNILSIILEEKNYTYICVQESFQDFITNCLNIIYLNSKTNLIFLLLIKKIDNFIEYIINNNSSYKEPILKIRKSFKNYHSEEYLNYKKEFKILNIYDLSKSNELKDKKESLNLLTKTFNNLKYFSEKYDLLSKISNEIFPSLLNLILPSLSHKKNTKIIELYINIGNFLLNFFFNRDYIFDFSSFGPNSKEASDKLPCLFFFNENEINDLSELNDNKYNVIYKYEIIKEYSNELVDIILNYYIKPMIIYDTNFDIQFIIFKLLKYLYFICENKNEDIKNKFINYIPEILNNLSFFKKQDEFNLASEAREFGYYLLLKDSKFKCIIKSMTTSPKNEIDIYTTKHNIGHDLLNNSFYIKEEIESGKSFEIFENLNKKFNIIYLEFYVENNKEITVTVFKKNVKDSNYEQIGYNNVIKTLKKDNNENDNNYKIAKIIIINSSSPPNINDKDNNNELNYNNDFKIVFDNYDSWFTKRIIHYSFSIFEISDI